MNLQLITTVLYQETRLGPVIVILDNNLITSTITSMILLRNGVMWVVRNHFTSFLIGAQCMTTLYRFSFGPDRYLILAALHISRTPSALIRGQLEFRSVCTANSQK